MTRKNSSFLKIAFLLPLLAPFSVAAIAAGCSAPEADHEVLGSDDSALTAAQCAYFDVNGKDQICHHTGSAAHPYTIIKTSEQGCVNGHTGHAGDYITSTNPSDSTYDPTCNGQGCLPVGAPADSTIECCAGLVAQNGVCVTAGPCVHGVGTVVAQACGAPNGYSCACEPGWYGHFCDVPARVCPSEYLPDATNSCSNGAAACTSVGDPEYDVPSKDFCICGPGWTGNNCDREIEQCDSDPCGHGNCVNTLDSYACDCAPGWGGTDCVTACP
jgi:hypothetical protein